tara:strand:- start:1474 stop:1740 length:267 start_codon:yes stop_codon:yes gene_type:complete
MVVINIMKIKGVLTKTNYIKNPTFSLDIEDEYGNTIVKGTQYSFDKFKEGVTINTNISLFTVSLICKSNIEINYYNITYSTDKGYIKI